MYLEIDNISKSYGTGDSRVVVLKGISCGIEKGDICVLLGPSGSGKSTLLNIVIILANEDFLVNSFKKIF